MSAPPAAPAAGSSGPDAARVALAFLADASAVLAASLDARTTLASVLELAVPRVADWCAVELAEPDGSTATTAAHHPDPDRDRVLDELERRHPGHWAALVGDGTPRPVLQTEVDPELLDRLARDPEHRRLLGRLDPQGWMVVPLVVGGRSLGALVLLSTDPARRYAPTDLLLAEDLARRCAQAIENSRLHRQAREAERRSDRSLALLDTLFESAPVGLAFFDLDLRYVRVNQALAEINGLPVEAHLGRPLTEVLPDLPPQVPVAFRGVMESGEALVDVEISGITPARPGVERTWLGSYYPVPDASGGLLGLGAVLIEVTEQRRAAAERERLLEAEREAHAEAEAQRHRAELLNRASELLDESLEFERTLSSLGGIVVPELAEWYAVFIVGEDGRLRQVAAAHADPEKAPLARELGRRYPGRITDPAGPGHVLASGRAGVTDDIAPELLGAVIEDAEHLDLLRRLAPRSGLAVPLSARGRTLGVMTFASSAPRRFGRSELDFARNLGRRAALRIDNALLFRAAADANRRERRNAEQLAGLAAAALAVASAASVADALDVAARRAREVAGAGAARVTIAAVSPAVPSRGAQATAPEAPGPEADPGGLSDHVGATRQVLRLAPGEVAAHPAWAGTGRAPDGYLGVPLVGSRGRAIGLLELLDGAFGAEEETALGALARTAAVSVERLRLAEERERVARTLQASLLPPGEPTLPGLEVGTRYRAAGEGEVGGDFYDLFTTAGRWWLVIGDVRGKGPEAAAITALARYTLRAAAMTEPDPRRVLLGLNAAMLAQRPGEFCTVALAAGEPVGPAGVRLGLTCAGHPPPLVLRQDGRVETAGRPGTLLGVVPDPRLHEVACELGPGDALLFFTDGVTEARVRSWALGEEGLATLLAGCSGLSALEIVERIERTVVDVQAGDPRDDIALVAVRVPPPI